MKKIIMIVLMLGFFVACGKNSSDNRIKKDVQASPAVEDNGMEAYIPEQSDHDQANQSETVATEDVPGTL